MIKPAEEHDWHIVSFHFGVKLFLFRVSVLSRGQLPNCNRDSFNKYCFNYYYLINLLLKYNLIEIKFYHYMFPF